MSDPADAGAVGTPRRLSPLGILLHSLTSAPQLIVPALAGLWSMKGNAIGTSLFLLFLAAVSVGIAVVRWSAFRYTVERDEIRIEQGILHRQTRAIPFDRIVDVGIEQQALARIAGLAEVTFDSGGGAGEEAKLRYVPLAEAHDLRQLVRGRGSVAASSEAAPEGPDLLFAMGPRRIVTMGFYSFSLVVFAIALAVARRLDFLLPDAWFDPDTWWTSVKHGGESLGSLGLWVEVLAGLAALAALAALGVLSGVIRAVTAWWDFRLERTIKGLRVRFGLLTRRDVTVPPGRVLAAALQTGPIRSRRGWQALQLVSLGGNGEAGAHITAAPFARADEIAAIMDELNLVPPERDLPFGRASAAVARDRFLLGAGLLGGLAVAGWWISPLISLALVFMAAGHGLRTWLHWRRRGRAVSADQIFTRAGWWRRQILFARKDAVQLVTLTSGPVQRRHAVATLVFGLPSVTAAFEDIPVAEAEAIRDAVLRRIVPVDYAHLAALLAAPREKRAEA